MTRNISLESRLLLTLEGNGRSVFTTNDAKGILKTTDSSVWHVLNGLAHKNRIRRIERGRHLLIPARAGTEGHWAEHPWAIVLRLIDAYYVGFWIAMNFWGMTEQIPRHQGVSQPRDGQSKDKFCLRRGFRSRQAQVETA